MWLWRAAVVADDLITPRRQATGLRREQELSACQEQRPGVWPLTSLDYEFTTGNGLGIREQTHTQRQAEEGSLWWCQ